MSKKLAKQSKNGNDLWGQVGESTADSIEAQSLVADHADGTDEATPQFERDEVNSGLLAIIGIFLAVTVCLIVVLLQAWFYNYKSNLTSTRTLQSNDPQTLLGKSMIEQKEQISTYHWINREAGVRAIPIDRSMELVAREIAAQQQNQPKK
jgi:hypothetical protein